MPNWCDNSITLSNSDKTKIDALEEELNKENENGRSDANVFNHLRPRPLEEEENWYDWNVNHWGTKWDADIYDSSRQDDNTIYISCGTAWAPPIHLYEYLVENGWQVNALYHEPGMGFCGTYDNEIGDNYYEYDITDLESIEALPEDCIEFGGLREEHEYWKENQEEEGNETKMD
jgi:hypothetical protein